MGATGMYPATRSFAVSGSPSKKGKENEPLIDGLTITGCFRSTAAIKSDRNWPLLSSDMD